MADLWFLIWQKLSECIHQSAVLLQSKTSDDAETALEVIAEALQMSSYSEELLEMKAEALLIVSVILLIYTCRNREVLKLDGLLLFKHILNHRKIVGVVITFLQSCRWANMKMQFSCVS